MTAVILTAGLSSRLRPLTDTLPKALLPVGGKPLLQRTLETLTLPDIDRLVVVTGFQHRLVEEFVSALRLPIPVTFVFNQRFASTNNNYSLWLAGPQVSGDALVLVDCDILFSQEILKSLLAFSRVDALIVRSREAVGTEEMKVILDPPGRVLRIGKEIAPEAATGESVGIEKFSSSTVRSLFAALDRRRDHNEFYEAAFQELIDSGTKIYAIDCGQQPCMEIDTPDDLRAAEELALAHRL